MTLDAVRYGYVVQLTGTIGVDTQGARTKPPFTVSTSPGTVSGTDGSETMREVVEFHLQVDRAESTNVSKYAHGKGVLSNPDVGWLVSELKVACNLDPSLENATEDSAGGRKGVTAGSITATLVDTGSYASPTV